MQRTPRQIHASSYFRTHLNKIISGDSEMIIAGKSYKIGRDASTGKFIPVKESAHHKRAAVVETIKKRGK